MKQQKPSHPAKESTNKISLTEIQNEPSATPQPDSPPTLPVDSLLTQVTHRIVLGQARCHALVEEHLVGKELRVVLVGAHSGVLGGQLYQHVSLATAAGGAAGKPDTREEEAGQEKGALRPGNHTLGIPPATGLAKDTGQPGNQMIPEPCVYLAFEFLHESCRGCADFVLVCAQVVLREGNALSAAASLMEMEEVCRARRSRCLCLPESSVSAY